MWMSYGTGLALMVALAVGWVAVQNAWRAAFPGVAPGGDVLAGRGGCRGCDSEHECSKEELT